MVTRTVQPENICECKSATNTWGHFNEESILMKLYYRVTSLTTTSDWCPSESVKYVLGYCCKKKKNTHEVKYFLTGILHGIITKISTAPLLIPNRKWCECQLCNINKRNVEELLIAIDIYISLLSKFQDQMTKEKLEKRVFAVTQEAESRTNGKRHFTLPKSIKRWKLATASSRELLFWRTWKTPSYILLA